MNANEPVLDALPLDSTPDSGPLHRGGPFTFFIALSCGMTALGASIILHRQGHTTWAAACLLAFGTIAVRAVWYLTTALRHRGSLPPSHSVLTDALGFRIHSTCRDVAATVFLDPDQLIAGSPVRLLCFLENYASRQRIANLRIGPHQDLGLPRPLHVSLQLAAGQAAVYVLPLAVSSTLSPGEHDVPVTLKVRKPTGTGVRLPRTRRHLYDQWTVHFAAPFTLNVARSATPADTRAPQTDVARFITLASVSEAETRVGALENVVANATPAATGA